MLMQVTNAPPSPAQETWPATWRHSRLGKAGLALLGLAFLIATCIQLQGVLTKQWHKDYRWAARNDGVQLWQFAQDAYCCKVPRQQPMHAKLMMSNALPAPARQHMAYWCWQISRFTSCTIVRQTAEVLQQHTPAVVSACTPPTWQQLIHLPWLLRLLRSPCCVLRV
jgi:hypothetical protein